MQFQPPFRVQGRFKTLEIKIWVVLDSRDTEVAHFETAKEADRLCERMNRVAEGMEG